LILSLWFFLKLFPFSHLFLTNFWCHSLIFFKVVILNCCYPQIFDVVAQKNYVTTFNWASIFNSCFQLFAKWKLQVKFLNSCSCLFFIELWFLSSFFIHLICYVCFLFDIVVEVQMQHEFPFKLVLWTHCICKLQMHEKLCVLFWNIFQCHPIVICERHYKDIEK
jgi:hypothetical protein